MDKVVHFEIPADDMGRTQKFYQEVFGWDVKSMPEFNYTMVRTGPVDEQMRPTETGFINGGMMKRGEKVKAPVITIQVESIEEASKSIEAKGGKVIQEKMSVGGMGFSAYFSDSEGNVLGLWEDIKK